MFYEFSELLHYHDVSTKGNPINYIWKYWNGIRKIIKILQPDIISVCDDGLKGLLFPLIFRTENPVVYERHTVKQIFRDKKKNTFFNKLRYKIEITLADYGSKQFDEFIVLTEQNAQEWTKINALVIPNPISLMRSLEETS